MSKIYGIGIDLGATHVRAVLSDKYGKFLVKLKQETRRESARAISDQILEMVYQLCKSAGLKMTEVCGVGIASIGPLRLKEGEIFGTPNLPFKRIPLVKPIYAELRKRVCLLNDCTAGALGEREFGAGEGMDNLVYIGLGTGIGGGAFVDGNLLLGKDGNAVEIGHITIDPSGRLKCGCGGRGHWEAYCSGRNMPNFLRLKLEGMGRRRVEKSSLYELSGRDLSNLSAEVFFDAARAGDSVSLELVEEMGRLNAIGFANVINAYDPSLITVGGSLALKNEKLVMNPIKKCVKNYVICRLPKITITPLGEDVSLYGAVALAFGRLSSRI